jgi:hypothetical protein
VCVSPRVSLARYCVSTADTTMNEGVCGDDFSSRPVDFQPRVPVLAVDSWIDWFTAVGRLLTAP